MHKGKCISCRTERGNLSCQQVGETSTFTNRITEKVYKIFHQLNCKRKLCVYLLECTKCHNRPYVGKFETYGNESITNHRTDAKKTDSIKVDPHFNQAGHYFTRPAKFTFIKQITKRNLSKTQMITPLKQHKDFWIMELQIRLPNGFMGLRVNLTPTFGNNNDVFIEKCHKRLEAFSITIIEDIVEFCDKTINEAKITEHAAKEKVKSKTTPDTNI